MLTHLTVVLTLANIALGQHFLEYSSVNYTEGNSFNGKYYCYLSRISQCFYRSLNATDCKERFVTSNSHRKSKIIPNAIGVSTNISPYAFGGFRAYRTEFQHMAAIGWTRSETWIEYLCGGSLITWKFALTAAHCSQDINR